ncbi:heat shock protein 67B2 [Salpingoeca rosetta]|uniref:Heat shock protein 67B2 n=1 Tax=Salpingoeca rosetta (strain ATCC 50818 / BSB-021) TaxID=946362 RepID=F2U7R3_SALR5|nr:heat shock protein 67B2 [Salpingoeca rosetta]EGD72818.1 heat shock protein 67B2 [Salpingoeca rosetta]|eukprot:XP_004994641.1 heat shock protein 67B2 [Salpingoeca rosetta]
MMTTTMRVLALRMTASRLATARRSLAALTRATAVARTATATAATAARAPCLQQRWLCVRDGAQRHRDDDDDAASCGGAHEHLHTSSTQLRAIGLDAMKHCVGAHDTFIMDVREPSEFEQGHIPTAVNVPLNTLLNSDVDASDPEDAWVGGVHLPTSDQKVVVYCKAGVRSHLAQVYLASKGWKNCSNYVGSWLQWSQDPETQKVVAAPSSSSTAGAPPAATASSRQGRTQGDAVNVHLFDDLVVRKPLKWTNMPVVDHFSADQWDALHALPLLTVPASTQPTDTLHPKADAFLLMRKLDASATAGTSAGRAPSKEAAAMGYELYFVDTAGYDTARYAFRIGSRTASALVADRL